MTPDEAKAEIERLPDDDEGLRGTFGALCVERDSALAEARRERDVVQEQANALDDQAMGFKAERDAALARAAALEGALRSLDVAVTPLLPDVAMTVLDGQLSLWLKGIRGARDAARALLGGGK